MELMHCLADIVLPPTAARLESSAEDSTLRERRLIDARAQLAAYR